MYSSKYDLQIPILEPTPIQTVDISDLLGSKAVLHIKRDDLTHKYLSGNKWRKLKYNIQHVREHRLKGIVSFGGAFSNHIYALSAAGALYGFEVVLYIRGSISDENNPTLNFCRDMGAQLISVSREDYRLRSDPMFLDALQKEWSDYHIVAEGGTNSSALIGVAELMSEINDVDKQYDTISVAAGTGGTAAGIIKSNTKNIPIVVYSSLKGDFMEREIGSMLPRKYDHWIVNNAYHLGGYARTNTQYVAFLNEWYDATQIALDPIYTGKMVYGILDQMKHGEIDQKKDHLIIHTGGIQGIHAHNYMKAQKLGFINS